MKILLFGKNGQVGWELQRSLAPLGELVALDFDSPDLCGDFMCPDGIADTVRAIAPDVIVNAAAHTAVDKAESEPDGVRTINARIKAAIEEAFTDNRYLEKMQDFYREVAEKALSHESSFDMDAKRMDLLDSTYRMGVEDALRKARRNILAEVEPYKQAGAPEDTGFLSQWQHYSNLSPWRSITTIVLLSLTSYLIAFIIASDTFRQLMERFGWAGGSGL